MTMYNQFPQYAGNHDEPENEMPYAYGMSNQLPLPMNPSPASAMPPLFPSMMSPELYPQAPFSSSNLMQARYAQGGEVRAEGIEQDDQAQKISALAQIVQQFGEGEDTILAHINRDEAQMLANQYGSDINPMTGLPQFGFMRKLKKAVRHPKQMARYALPVIGSIIGNVVGGPVGGAIGGAIGGAGGAAIAKKDILKGAAIGATTGYGGGHLYQAGSGALGSTAAMGPKTFSSNQGFGTMAPMKGFGSLPGMKSLGSSTGLHGFGGSLPGGSGGLRAMFGSGASAGGSGVGSALSSLLSSEGLLDKALLATAIGGTLMRREKRPKEPSLNEIAAMNQPHWRPDQYPRRTKPLKQEVIPFPGQYDPSIHGEHVYFSDVNPSLEYYNHGGAVSMDRGGYLDGDTDGHADEIPAKLSDGEYVIDATTVAHLGNGNNRAGAKKLDQMVRNIRHHKGVKGFPPKAKSLRQYMAMR